MRDKDCLLLNTLQQFIYDYNQIIDSTYIFKIAEEQNEALLDLLKVKFSSHENIDTKISNLDFNKLIGKMDTQLTNESNLDQYYDITLAYCGWMFCLIEKNMIKFLFDLTDFRG